MHPTAPIVALSEWAPSPSMGAVTAVAIGHGGSILVATNMGKLIRLSAGTGTGEYEELDMPQGNRSAHVNQLFADTQTSVALLATLSGSAETVYFHKGRARTLGKLKGVNISAVAWLRLSDLKADVREVLVGSTTGALYEAAIEPLRTRYVRQLYMFHPQQPILGLTLEPCPPEAHWHVLVATPSRLFEFVGGPTIESLFTDNRESASANAARRPIEKLGDAMCVPYAPSIQLCYCSSGTPSAFSWATGAGLYHGSLLMGTAHASETAIADFGLLRYPHAEQLGVLEHGSGLGSATAAAASKSAVPVAVALTDFHYLLLYPSTLLAISRLNDKLVCRALPPAGWPNASMAGILHDSPRKATWVWGPTGVLRVQIVDEDRHAWRLYLEAADFESALYRCSPTDLKARDLILSVQSDHEFHRGMYELAAMQYAKTTSPIEQVGLRFHNARQLKALRAFLLRKLDSVADAQKAQVTLLCMWLTQTYLHIEVSSLEGDRKQVRVDDFGSFLANHHFHLHRSIICRLLAALGCDAALLRYALLCEDWERFAALQLQLRDARSAFEVLRRLATGSSGREGIDLSLAHFLERHGMELLKVEHVATLELWQQVSGLHPMGLLPAIMSAEDTAWCEAMREAVRYLSTLDDTGPIVHNTLMWLHAQSSDTGELVAFLSTDMLYDPEYALNVCRECERPEACLLLLEQASSYVEVIRVALWYALPEQACRVAAIPHLEDVLRRILALELLTPLSSNMPCLSVHDCIRVLTDNDGGSVFCDGVSPLRLEDVLPLLDEYLVGTDLKELVCESLAVHAASCAELRKVLDACVSRSGLLSRELATLRQASGALLIMSTCSCCHRPLEADNTVSPCRRETCAVELMLWTCTPHMLHRAPISHYCRTPSHAGTLGTSAALEAQLHAHRVASILCRPLQCHYLLMRNFDHYDLCCTAKCDAERSRHQSESTESGSTAQQLKRVLSPNVTGNNDYLLCKKSFPALDPQLNRSLLRAVSHSA